MCIEYRSIGSGAFTDMRHAWQNYRAGIAFRDRDKNRAVESLSPVNRPTGTPEVKSKTQTILYM